MLLDTHVWIWEALDEAGRLGPHARRALARAGARFELRLSPASIFELSALHTAGRLRLAQPIDQWIRDSFERGGLRLVELTPAIAIDAGAIPTRALPDPVDRLLVATARAFDLRLVTRDRRILDYAADSGHVRVVDAAA